MEQQRMQGKAAGTRSQPRLSARYRKPIGAILIPVVKGLNFATHLNPQTTAANIAQTALNTCGEVKD